MKSIASLFTKTALFIAVVSLSLGCTKTDDRNNASKRIEGIYIGTVQNSQEGSEYNLVIKPGGNLTFNGYARGVHIFGVGTWQRNGSDFNARVETVYGPSDFVGIQQALTAKYNPASGELTDCRYVNISLSSDAGTFTVTRVQ
jgi:hypothetical protein